MRHCRHCDDEIARTSTCSRCGDSLHLLRQCLACHLELAHDVVVPEPLDLRDPKTSLVATDPPIPRPTKSFDPPAFVHEGNAGQSLADGFAMLDGYEDDRDRYQSNRKPSRKFKD